jgi:hypothetical protein
LVLPMEKNLARKVVEHFSHVFISLSLE